MTPSAPVQASLLEGFLTGTLIVAGAVLVAAILAHVGWWIA